MSTILAFLHQTNGQVKFLLLLAAILTEGSKLREGIKEVKQSENNLGQVDSKAIEGNRIYSGIAVINLGLEAEWVCLDMALLS
jgi:hypothetical protein